MAVNYMEAMKEKAFDPEIVNIFLGNMDKVIEIWEKYKD